MSSLNAGTAYHFRMMSKDSDAVLVTSPDYTFTTQPAPVTVSITPAAVSLQSGGIQQFAATVANSSQPRSHLDRYRGKCYKRRLVHSAGRQQRPDGHDQGY
jgi:hypothetical protein